MTRFMGPGGYGKTRLIDRRRDAALPHFPGGVWFVDLAPLAEGAYVAGDRRAQRSVYHRRREHSTEERLTAELRSRSLLLVFDNCEHLLDSSAALASRLLSHMSRSSDSDNQSAGAGRHGGTGLLRFLAKIFPLFRAGKALPTSWRSRRILPSCWSTPESNCLCNAPSGESAFRLDAAQRAGGGRYMPATRRYSARYRTGGGTPAVVRREMSRRD
jgi:hypothetical protein